MNINDIKKKYPETKTNHPQKPSYHMIPTAGPNMLKLWDGKHWEVLHERNGILYDTENNIYFE